MKVQGAFGEISPVGAAGQGKRRKVSPDRPPVALSTPSSTEAVSPNPSLPTVVFDHAEFLAFFQKGIERAQYANQGTDAEKASLRQSFEASISRANRRVHEAQERLRWQQYESGEKFKAKDRELNEKLKARARDHAEEKEAMRKDFEREMKHLSEIQVKNIEALQRQNELLRRDFEYQRRQMELQAQEYEREVSRLRTDRHQTRSTTKIQDIVNGVAKGSEDTHIKQSPKEQSATLDGAENAIVPSWRKARQNQLNTFQQLVEDVDTLATAITRLNRDVETMTMKSILADIKALDANSVLALESKGKASDAVKAFHAEADMAFKKASTEQSTDERRKDDIPNKDEA